MSRSQMTHAGEADVVHEALPARWTMDPLNAIGWISSIALAALLAACSVLPTNFQGSRPWAVTVDNQSNQPAVIFVGEDVSFGDPKWRAVGTSVPATVANLSSRLGRSRARFVRKWPNAGRNRGWTGRNAVGSGRPGGVVV